MLVIYAEIVAGLGRSNLNWRWARRTA